MVSQLAVSDNDSNQSPPTDTESKDLLAPLTLWQRRYLIALQSGLPEVEASKAANCSLESVATWLRKSEAFACAHEEIVRGIMVAGPEAARNLALANAGGMVLDAVNASRDPMARGADQLGNRRLVLEVAQLTGQGARTSVSVQVAIVPSDHAKPATLAEGD